MLITSMSFTQQLDTQMNTHVQSKLGNRHVLAGHDTVSAGA